jgi:hypothetical protein
MFSAYGALDESGSKLTVMLINKDPKQSKDVTLQPEGFTAGDVGHQFRYDGTGAEGPTARMFVVSNPKSVSVSVPPMSISMVVLNSAQK